MDKEITPAPLLDLVLTNARALGLSAQSVQPDVPVGRAAAAERVRIGRAGAETLYAVEVKNGLRPATLGATIHQMERGGQPALLVADHVTPALADELKARGVPFIDAAGNAFLEQPGLFVWVNGRKPIAKPVHETVGRAFQSNGLKVVFALLCNPGWINRPYRELAAQAEVAHGTVGAVMADLQRAGFMAENKGKRGTRRLFNAKELLDQWVDAYARTLRPRTRFGRYYVQRIEGWKAWPLAEHGAMWGGEPAGALLTGYLQPGELTIYADKMPALLAAQHKFLKDPQPGHSAVVEVRRRFWRFTGDPRNTSVVPPILVYADLLATGDVRCIETAKLIYQADVARLFAKS